LLLLLLMIRKYLVTTAHIVRISVVDVRNVLIVWQQHCLLLFSFLIELLLMIITTVIMTMVLE